MINEYFQYVMAILALFTAGCAAYATWRAPLSAAELAENLRQASQKNDDQRRMKMHVFATVMQERAAIYSLDGVRALNLIDVVFHDCRPVREAWAELHQSYDTTRGAVPPHAQEERLRRLLIAMATDLGLGDQLRNDDFARTYFPNALLEEETVRRLQRKAALAQLSGQPATANTSPEVITSSSPSPYPERPT
jgi:hypothetical protein